MIPVPDAEAERSVKITAPKPIFDLDSPAPKAATKKRDLSTVTPESDEIGSVALSATLTVATTNLSRKRIKVSDVRENALSKLCLLSPIPQSPPSTGCRWSAENLSCAYDTVFMVLFYVYRAADTVEKERWRVVGNPLRELAEAYEVLLENDANLFRQDLFDRYRDEFWVWLSSLDSAVFLCTGQVGTSSTSILECMLPPASRAYGFVYACSNTICEIDSLVLPRTFPALCTPLQWSHLNSTSSSQSVNVQNWLDLWCSSQQARHSRRNPPHSSLGCHGAVSISLHLTTLLSILFFECINLNPVAPCESIVVPYLRGVAQYHLVGMIYLGGYHFSARFCAGGGVWNYNGHANNGDPFLEPNVQDFDLCMLQQFNSRGAHVLIYAFQALSPQ